MSKTYDAFIFDLDGTLLDTLDDLVVLTNKALNEVGLPPRSKDEIHSYVGNGIKALMFQAVPEGTDQQTIDKAMELWKAMYPEHGTSLTKPYAGIPEVIKTLKASGKKLAVLSNKFDAGTKVLIEQFFPGEFDVVYGVNDEIPRKPDPAGLLRVINELDVDIDAAVYVGDSPGDMLTAERAQCAGLCVTWGYHCAESLSAAGISDLINSPKEILDNL